MSTDSELKGVGGWLAFFVLALCVIGPAMAINSTFMAFDSFENSTPGAATLESWQRYKQYTWVVIAIPILLRLVAGIRLTTAFKRSSVYFAVIVLWVTPIVSAIGSYIALRLAFGAQAEHDVNTMTVEILKGCAVATAWTMYLLKSQRVKNTYSLA